MEKVAQKDVDFLGGAGSLMQASDFCHSCKPTILNTSLLNVYFFLNDFLFKGLSLVLVKIK